MEEPKKYKVLWVDVNNASHNLTYLNQYREYLKDFDFLLATTVEQGYELLAKEENQYQRIFIITSGRLSLDFLLQYEKNLKKLNVATSNIIFCNYKKVHEAKVYANDPWYNPGKVVTSFEEVINYLRNSTIEYEKSLEFEGKIKKDDFIAGLEVKDKFLITKNDDVKQLIIPTILGELLNESLISKEEIDNFYQFVFSYGNGGCNRSNRICSYFESSAIR